MAHMTIAKPTGHLDIEPPDWITSNESLKQSWGSFLVALNAHGAVRHLRRSDTLQVWPNEVALLISGGLLATEMRKDDEERLLLVDFFKRGDLCTSNVSGSINLTLTAHGSTSCLVLPVSALEVFKADFPDWEPMSTLMRANLAQSFLNAIDETACLDEERIERVLRIMAQHPSAVPSRLGLEVEAGKKQIRDLAGVQKRSATRAFSSLVDRGFVLFYGYKRLFVKIGMPS